MLVLIDTKAYILRELIDDLLLYILFFSMNRQGTVRRRVLFIAVFFPITFLVALYSDISNVIPILSGYFILKEKKENDYLLLNDLLFCTFIIFGCNVLSSNIMLQILPSNRIVGFFGIFLQLFIEALVISIIIFFYRKNNLHNVKEKYASKTVSYLLIYLLLVILLISYAAHYYDAYDHFVLGIMIFLIIQTVFVVFIFLRMLTKQRTKYKNQIEKQELNNLKKYTESLEQQQQQISKFRHDYKNLLLSFKENINTNNKTALTKQIEELEQYSNRYLDKGEFDYKALYNIHNEFVKSLIIAKIHQAKELNIECYCECQKPLDIVPIPIFDCIRILGILINNAIEAASECNEKILYLVIYQDDLQIEFSIKNTYKKSNMSIGTLQRKNISTKKGHSGLGLNTIQEFNQKFPNVFTQYKQEESFFSVQLIIIK
ncbi:GHKL domain-containing protein [Latilactobacillus sakei]|nr:GHKL domain-containing protein [Latilactobacillus sakei]PKX70456.1 GHKL domain-containing protein [Latilactobacillus sakei]